VTGGEKVTTARLGGEKRTPETKSAGHPIFAIELLISY
jgi:hypothetical protein